MLEKSKNSKITSILKYLILETKDLHYSKQIDNFTSSEQLWNFRNNSVHSYKNSLNNTKQNWLSECVRQRNNR